MQREGGGVSGDMQREVSVMYGVSCEVQMDNECLEFYVGPGRRDKDHVMLGHFP